jgi:hypothetical protein
MEIGILGRRYIVVQPLGIIAVECKPTAELVSDDTRLVDFIEPPRFIT